MGLARAFLLKRMSRNRKNEACCIALRTAIYLCPEQPRVEFVVRPEKWDPAARVIFDFYRFTASFSPSPLQTPKLTKGVMKGTRQTFNKTRRNKKRRVNSSSPVPFFRRHLSEGATFLSWRPISLSPSARSLKGYITHPPSEPSERAVLPPPRKNCS